MNQGNELDEIFKSGLGEMQLNPPEYVWGNIESTLEEKKDRRGLWVWFLAILMIIGVTIGTYASLSEGAPKNADSGGLVVDNENRVQQADKDRLKENTLNSGMNGSEEIAHITNSKITERANNEILPIDNSKDIINGKSDQSKLKSARIKVNKHKERNDNDKSDNKHSFSAKYLDEAKIKFSTDVFNKLNKTKEIYNTNLNNNLDKPKEILNQRKPVDIVPLESINNGLIYKKASAKASEAFIQKNTECYSFAQRGSGRVALEIYGGPAVALKSLRDKEDVGAGGSLYQNRREETETSRLGTNVGFKVEFGIKPNLSVKTGINYTLLNERFDYENNMEERITIIYVRDMNGVIIDSTLTREFGTRLKTSYNRYHLIDIPILISYSVNTKSLSMALNAGALVNLYFGQRGDIIEPTSTLMPTSITSGESIYPIFKNNVGVSLYAGLSVYYPIRKSIDLVFEPNIRHILRPVTLDVHPIEQAYTIFGANLGLRFRFN